MFFSIIEGDILTPTTNFPMDLKDRYNYHRWRWY